MKNLKTKIITLLTIIVLATSAVFAWYDNNKEVSATSDNSIRVAGSGTLQIAFAHNNKGDLLKPEEASYTQAITLDLNDNGFDDITGNGTRLCSPIFEVNGDLAWDLDWDIETANDDEGADNAAVNKDSGKYVYLDLYFKSDLPMTIYLNEESSLAPKTNDNNKDLTNNNGFEGLTLFSNFPDGLPTKNINQSTYGFFSRNMIAGAARVSFNEYELSYADSTLTSESKDYPNLVWVPNSTYHLTIPSDSNKLDTMKIGTDADKEKTYTYYYVDDSQNKTLYTIRRNSSNKLIGELLRIDDDDRIVVQNTICVGDTLMPANIYALGGSTVSVPAIYVNGSYEDAGLYKDKYYEVTYNSTHTSFAYIIDSTLAIYNADDEVFKEAELSGDLYIEKEDGLTWTEEDALTKFVSSDTKYEILPWMEDDFELSSDGLYRQSEYSIGSTSFSYVDTGPYYTRIRILVWVEGTDREANIALNGGQFSIDLLFIGENKND